MTRGEMFACPESKEKTVGKRLLLWWVWD